MFSFFLFYVIFAVTEDWVRSFVEDFVRGILQSIFDGVTGLIDDAFGVIRITFQGAMDSIRAGWVSATDWVSAIAPPLAPIAPLVILIGALVTIWVGYKVLLMLL